MADDFFSGMGESISGAASNAFEWATETDTGKQVMAGVAAGAAQGAAQYLIQQDAQRHEEKLADKKYKREVDLKLQYSQAPLIDTSQVGNGLLNAAAVMQGDSGIVARKKVQ